MTPYSGYVYIYTHLYPPITPSILLHAIQTDTARCVELAVNNPPAPGQRVEIFNQVAETLRIEDVAQLISNQTGVAVNHLTNPRKEDASNELEVAHEKFANLGLHAVTLELALMDEVGRCWSKA